jgi:hypothetical protein
MAGRAGYFDEFASFWSARPEVWKIWFSLFTPQVGARDAEILWPAEREEVLSALASLRAKHPKVYLPDETLRGFRSPPRTPDECIFARTTVNYTADLRSRIKPCQFGGTPDCTQCGCIASAGLKAVGDYRVLGLVPLGTLYRASDAFGKAAARVFRGAA